MVAALSADYKLIDLRSSLSTVVWWAVGGGYFGKTNDTCEGIFQLDKNMWIATVIK